MTRIDLDTQGFAELDAKFEELSERAESDAVYEVESGAEYSVSIELGRGPILDPDAPIPIETESGTIFRKSVSGHQPYPWFRPAVREFELDPLRFIRQNTGVDPKDVESTDDLIVAAALSLVNQMTANVSARSGGDRSGGTNRNHPQRQTGNLAASIERTRIK